MTAISDSRLFTACYRSALLGRVKSWHATAFEDGRVEQLVEMFEDEDDPAETAVVRRAYYSELRPETATRLRRAVSSRIFHELEDSYETPEGLLHYRELNSARIAEGRHRVATCGACALARAGQPDMIIFMGIWEKIRSVLPVVAEEPRSDFGRDGLLNDWKDSLYPIHGIRS